MIAQRFQTLCCDPITNISVSYEMNYETVWTTTQSNTWQNQFNVTRGIVGVSSMGYGTPFVPINHSKAVVLRK